jgi:hypothetical protein
LIQDILHKKTRDYRGKTTIGELLDPNCNHFSWTLEDTVRAYGIKAYGDTAIPATKDDFTYYLRVMESPKYGKVATIYTHLENGVPVVDYGGIRFTYIRSHGGNSEKDTHGCLLVAANKNIKNLTIQGSMKEEFSEEVQRLTDEGFDCRLRVTNLPQSK